MYCLELINNNCTDTILDVNCFNRTIANIPFTNFLCSLTDDTLTWEMHTCIDQLISTMNFARYAITAVQKMLSGKVFRKLYFSFVHSVVSYGMIMSGNTASSIKIVRIHK